MKPALIRLWQRSRILGGRRHRLLPNGDSFDRRIQERTRVRFTRRQVSQEFGKKGTGPGEIHVGTRLPSTRRSIFVSDRENKRIQVFVRAGSSCTCSPACARNSISSRRTRSCGSNSGGEVQEDHEVQLTAKSWIGGLLWCRAGSCGACTRSASTAMGISIPPRFRRARAEFRPEEGADPARLVGCVCHACNAGDALIPRTLASAPINEQDGMKRMHALRAGPWRSLVMRMATAVGVVEPGGKGQRGEVIRPGGEGLTGEYDVVPNWPQPLSTDWTWGKTDGIWAESRIASIRAVRRTAGPEGSAGDGWFAAAKRHCGGGHRPIRQAADGFNREGKLIESWTSTARFLSPTSSRSALRSRTPPVARRRAEQ